MEKNNGNIVNIIALLYLTLPIVIFAFGWLKIYYALFFIVLLSIAFFHSIHNFYTFEISLDKNNIVRYIFISVIVILWVGLSGIGGFAFQNADLEVRNAILSDLVQFRWPLVYDYTGQLSIHPLAHHHGALVYYLAYWLPAALAGKILGIGIAQWVLYFWTVIGILISLYLFCMHIKKKLSIILTLIFILWSGLDVIGLLIRYHQFMWGEHIEWWSVYYQYSSNTTTLFWVFNQTIPVWVALMLLLNQINNKSTFFVYALCLPYSPLPLIGLTPIVIVLSLFFYQGNDVPRNLSDVSYRINKKFLFKNIRSVVTFQNIVVPCVILFVWGSYYLLNTSMGNNSYFFLIIREKIYINYLLFCLLEFGLYAMLIWFSYRKDALFLTALISLFFIPFYYGGLANDFAMRSSIPALLIVMVYVSKYLFSFANYLKKAVLVVLMLIGSVTAWSEIYRSVYVTKYYYNHRLADHVQSLSNLHNVVAQKIYIDNCVVADPENKFFFRCLAKEIP